MHHMMNDATVDDASGDPRRCPVHPEVQTSSPDGLHDTPCGLCEYAIDLEAEESPDS